MRKRREFRKPLYDTDEYTGLQRRITVNLRAIRDRMGLTQKAAAMLCEMGQQQFWKIETGKLNVTFTTLARLAHGLRIDASELLAPTAEGREQPIDAQRSVSKQITAPNAGFVEWLAVRAGMRVRLRDGSLEHRANGRWRGLDRAKLRSDVGTLTGSADAPSGAIDILLPFTDGRQRVITVRAECVREVLPRLRSARTDQ